MCCYRHPVQTVGHEVKSVEFTEDHVGVCCPLRICHGLMLGNPTLSGSDVRGQGVTVIPHILSIGVAINIY